MKNNLKNRPKGIVVLTSPNQDFTFELGRKLGEFDRWFEGFEAELRERERKLHNGFMSDDAFGYAHSLIKELLGE